MKFYKINKTRKSLHKFSLARLRKRRKVQLNTDGRVDNTTDTTKIQRIIMNECELHAHTLDNLKEIGKFLNAHNLQN